MAPKSASEKAHKSHKRSEHDEPQLLAEVLQAVANLKQSGGSTTREIVAQMKTVLRSSPRFSKKNAARLVVHVRRALTYGVYTGLLKQQAGRYLLDKGKSKATPKRKPDKNQKKNKRDKRRRSSTHSQSGSTQGEETDNTECDYSDAAESDAQSHSKPKRGRRKRREGRQKRRRRDTRKRRRSENSDHSRSRSRSEQKKEPQPPKNPDEPSTPQQQQNEYEPMPSTSYICNRKNKRARRSNYDLHHKQVDEDATCDDQNKDVNGTPDCGNPDCICSMKQDPREPSPDAGPECGTEKTNDYIN